MGIFISYNVVLGIEAEASDLVGKHCTTALHPRQYSCALLFKKLR